MTMPFAPPFAATVISVMPSVVCPAGPPMLIAAAPLAFTVPVVRLSVPSKLVAPMPIDDAPLVKMLTVPKL